MIEVFLIAGLSHNPSDVKVLIDADVDSREQKLEIRPHPLQNGRQVLFLGFLLGTAQRR